MSFRILLGFTRFYWVLLGWVVCRWITSELNEHYRVVTGFFSGSTTCNSNLITLTLLFNGYRNKSPGFKGLTFLVFFFSEESPTFTRLYWVLIEFSLILFGFLLICNPILPGFTGFYWFIFFFLRKCAGRAEKWANSSTKKCQKNGNTRYWVSFLHNYICIATVSRGKKWNSVTSTGFRWSDSFLQGKVLSAEAPIKKTIFIYKKKKQRKILNHFFLVQGNSQPFATFWHRTFWEYTRHSKSFFIFLFGWFDFGFRFWTKKKR